MSDKSMFEIDCHDVIPECQYKCDGCISEMKGTFGKMSGVTNLYLETEGKEQFIVIEHDSQEVSREELMQVFTQLPSRYNGFFRPTLRGG